MNVKYNMCVTKQNSVQPDSEYGQSVAFTWVGRYKFICYKIIAHSVHVVSNVQSSPDSVLQIL